VNDISAQDRLEGQIYVNQERFIRETFGDRAANTANYGWGVDEVERVVMTKVYQHGVVTTSMDDPASHHFEEFEA
jgi:hypothetical protein